MSWTSSKTYIDLSKGYGLYFISFLIFLSMPLVLSTFRLEFIGQFITYAIIAVALDLIWGFGGILSLGQGVFFSLGAYSMAMYLKLQGEALPDFMSWSGLDKLPWFWEPFRHLGFALPMAILVPMLFALIIGYVTFRSGIKGVYFSILTQALALALSIFFIGQQSYTGGTNGMTNFTTIAGFSINDESTKIGLYIISLIVLLMVFVGIKLLIKSKTGRILQAIRDGENRLKFLGYNPVWYKVFVFTLAAGISGLAGALFVPQSGIISPSKMGILPSVEIAIWVAVGGRGTLSGAIVGALGVNLGYMFLSEKFPEVWQYFLGVLLICAILFFPKGIIAIDEPIKRLFNRKQEITG